MISKDVGIKVNQIKLFVVVNIEIPAVYISFWAYDSMLTLTNQALGKLSLPF